MLSIFVRIRKATSLAKRSEEVDERLRKDEIVVDHKIVVLSWA